MIVFSPAAGKATAIGLSGAPDLLAGLGASDFFYRRAMPGVLAKAGPAGWTGAGGLIHVARVGKGRVAYLAVRPEVFAVRPLPDRPKWQQTLVNWPTTKYYRILATLLANAGAGWHGSIDLRATTRSKQVYLRQPLDFDPMQSRTW